MLLTTNPDGWKQKLLHGWHPGIQSLLHRNTIRLSAKSLGTVLRHTHGVHAAQHCGPNQPDANLCQQNCQGFRGSVSEATMSCDRGHGASGRHGGLAGGIVG